jgi:protein O-mannosyl-transferase
MAAKHRKTRDSKPARQDKHYLIYLAIALLTVAVYWHVAGFEFVNYDDDLYVTQNVMVQRGLSLQTATWAFTTYAACNWHPLTWLSHLLDVRLYHAKAAGHHVTSLLLHIANALLLFAVLKRMTRSVWRSAFVAVLFAIHPLHVQSVAWVAERKDVLSTLFWMLTMLA